MTLNLPTESPRTPSLLGTVARIVTEMTQWALARRDDRTHRAEQDHDVLRETSSRRSRGRDGWSPPTTGWIVRSPATARSSRA